LTGEQLYLLAFIPTPSSVTAGGFFQLFKTEADELYEQGRMECSSFSAHCHLQDFIVIADNLHVLWDRQGRSMVEKTWLNPDEFNFSGIGNAWRVASYPEEPELTPAYLDELLLWPGSLTNKFFEAIMRPGMFSTFTLRTALDQYIDACLTLPGMSEQQLRMVLSSLGENILAVVGFTVNFLRDPTTGALQYDKYWNALKRDWEGFIARCREIERSARWPLVLSMDERKGLLVIERERIGCLVTEDQPLRLRRRLIEGIELTSNPYALMEILWALRVRLGTQAMWVLEGQMIDICHQDIAFTLADIVKDAAVRVDLKEYLEEGLDAWIGGRLQSIENMNEAARFVIDVLGSFDTVKEEVTEEIEMDISAPPQPPPHSAWSKALISSYIASTAHARYELSLTLALLFFFVPEYDWPPSLLDEMLAVFRGTAMVRFVVRQSANPKARSQSTNATADEVVTRLENMHVNANGRSHFMPTHSIVQHMLSQCLHIPSISQAAHLFLDQSGLLQSMSLSRATRFEVEFCHSVAKFGFTEISRQLLDWLPKTIGISYLYADLLIRAGRADDAAYLLEKLAPRFGES
jgi:nuclear pore complex protein Nup160